MVKAVFYLVQLLFEPRLPVIFGGCKLNVRVGKKDVRGRDKKPGNVRFVDGHFAPLNNGLVDGVVFFKSV